MPPGRRKIDKSSTSAHTSATGGQSTLSFNSKPARITKPAIIDATSKKGTRKSSESILDQLVEDVISPSAQSDSEIVEVPTREEAKTVVRDEIEKKAEKITNAQLRKYWRAEEDKRLAPRVHQEDLSMNEKILRHFDLSSQYGPCIGIPRTKRWKRAFGLGLNPPLEVLAVLLREEKKNTGSGLMAYIDELAGGRVVLVE